MKKYLLILILLFLYRISSAEENSALLAITETNDISFEKKSDGFDKNIITKNDECIVIGNINIPSFRIKSLMNVTVTNANGETIPLFIDKSSIYSEFDDEEINSLRMAFIIKKEPGETENYRLLWGDSIKGENLEIEMLMIFSENFYRSFSLEKSPPVPGNEKSYSASMEVIVDDSADTYYLWYLLPIFLIFLSLSIKKAFLK